MKTSKEKKQSLWLVIAVMQVFSYCGLLVCYLIGKILGVEINSNSPSLLFFAVLFFSGMMIIGLLVLLPIQVLYFERKARKNKPPEKMTAGDVIGLPFGAFNPNAQLPKWISIPVKVILWGIVGIFVLFIAFLLIGLTVSFFWGPEA